MDWLKHVFELQSKIRKCYLLRTMEVTECLISMLLTRSTSKYNGRSIPSTRDTLPKTVKAGNNPEFLVVT